MIEAHDKELCKESLGKVWSRFGMYTILISLAEMLEDEVKELQKVKYLPVPTELGHRETMIDHIKSAANSPLFIEEGDGSHAG